MNQWWECPRGETDAFLLRAPAVRKSALCGWASSSPSAPEINPNPRGARRSPPNSPCEVTRFSLKISSTLSAWNPLLRNDTAAHSQGSGHARYRISSVWQKDVLCFLNSRAINWSIIKLEQIQRGLAGSWVWHFETWSFIHANWAPCLFQAVHIVI